MTRDAEILQSFFDTVWNGGDAAAVRRFFAPDAFATGLVGGMELNAEDMVSFVQALAMHASAIEVHVDHVIAEGPWVSALIRSTATSRRTGRTLTLSGQTLVRFEGELIAEAYNHFDMLGLFMQMGLLPENAMERLLAGLHAD